MIVNIIHSNALDPDEIGPRGGEIISLIISIRAIAPSGEEITQFPGLVEICFSVEKLQLEDSCLAYVNKKITWDCVDETLTHADNGLVCGKTFHFTNFAILLTGRVGGDDDLTTTEKVIAWLALACIIVAIVIVFISIIVIEIQARRRAAKIKTKMEAFRKKQQAQQVNSSKPK